MWLEFLDRGLYERAEGGDKCVRRLLKGQQTVQLFSIDQSPRLKDPIYNGYQWEYSTALQFSGSDKHILVEGHA